MNASNADNASNAGNGSNAGVESDCDVTVCFCELFLNYEKSKVLISINIMF